MVSLLDTLRKLCATVCHDGVLCVQVAQLVRLLMESMQELGRAQCLPDTGRLLTTAERIIASLLLQPCVRAILLTGHRCSAAVTVAWLHCVVVWSRWCSSADPPQLLCGLDVGSSSSSASHHRITDDPALSSAIATAHSLLASLMLHLHGRVPSDAKPRDTM
jgi:hypothetical protein